MAQISVAPDKEPLDLGSPEPAWLSFTPGPGRRTPGNWQGLHLSPGGFRSLQSPRQVLPPALDSHGPQRREGPGRAVSRGTWPVPRSEGRGPGRTRVILLSPAHRLQVGCLRWPHQPLGEDRTVAQGQRCHSLSVEVPGSACAAQHGTLVRQEEGSERQKGDVGPQARLLGSRLRNRGRSQPR